MNKSVPEICWADDSLIFSAGPTLDWTWFLFILPSTSSHFVNLKLEPWQQAQIPTCAEFIYLFIFSVISMHFLHLY